MVKTVLVYTFNPPSTMSLVSCGSFSPSSFLSGVGCCVVDGWEALLSWEKSESSAAQYGGRCPVARASSAAEVTVVFIPDNSFAFLSARIRVVHVENTSY